jgi:hypothetical protein
MNNVKSLASLLTITSLSLIASFALGQNNVEKKDIVIRDMQSYFPAKCPSKRVFDHQNETGIGAYSFDIDNGNIENGRVRIEGEALGYRCDVLDQDRGEYLWRPVVIANNPTLQVLVQATSGKYRKVRFVNQRKFVYEDNIDQFFAPKDLEDFLQNRDLGIKSFDTLFVARDENGRVRENYTPPSRTYFYELVSASKGNLKMEFVRKR